MSACQSTAVCQCMPRDVTLACATCEGPRWGCTSPHYNSRGGGALSPPSLSIALRGDSTGHNTRRLRAVPPPQGDLVASGRVGTLLPGRSPGPPGTSIRVAC